jgi:osmotically-inducible protein OsmY
MKLHSYSTDSNKQKSIERAGERRLEMSSRYDDRDYQRESEGRRSEWDDGRSWGGRSQGRYRYGDNERTREGRSSREYGGESRGREYGRGEYGSRGEYGRSEYGGESRSGSRDEYQRGRQSYGTAGRAGWETERDDVEDRDDRYGGYRGGYGQGYEQSFGGYGSGYESSRGYGRGSESSADYDRGRYDRGSESRYGRGGYESSDRYRSSSDYSQRYNYPTGFRSSQPYNERGRTYDAEGGRYGRDYDRERYGGEQRGWWDRASDAIASWFGDEEAERRRYMDHQREQRGRGPKGYRRSDERIKEDVNDRLTEDYYLDASEITVEVANGEVTLNGTVDVRRDKRRAEDVVESVSGVTNVENRLRVKGGERNAYQSLDSSSRTSGASTSSAAAGATGAGTTGTGIGSTGISATERGTSGTQTSTSGTSATETGTSDPGAKGADRSRGTGTGS